MTKVRHLPIPELRIFKRVPIQFLFGFLPPSPRSFTTLYLLPFTFTDGLQKDEHLRPINKQFPVYFAIQSRPQWYIQVKNYYALPGSAVLVQSRENGSYNIGTQDVHGWSCIKLFGQKPRELIHSREIEW